MHRDEVVWCNAVDLELTAGNAIILLQRVVLFSQSKRSRNRQLRSNNRIYKVNQIACITCLKNTKAATHPNCSHKELLPLDLRKKGLGKGNKG